ncbi:hypothetical protein D6D01_08465, partial [Aureobasidium pullulans]
PPGPVATGILYAYLGCYVQTGSSTVTTGRALTSYQGTFTGQVNSRCSSTCLALNFVYFGTVSDLSRLLIVDEEALLTHDKGQSGNE